MEKQYGSPSVALVCLVVVACVVAPKQPPTAALAFGLIEPNVTAPSPSSVAPSSVAPKPPGSCPPEMVLVDADACARVEQRCLRWVDPPTSAFPHTRCAEFAPAKCAGARTHETFCVDRDEFVRPPETTPMVHVSWAEAESLCEARSARLCTEPEWELACGGPAMLAYPYGLVRDSSVCNFDRTDLGRPNEGLVDHREPPGTHAQCVSPFGVRDMVGNVDEWTRRARVRAPHRSALHGGWWLPGRNNCFAATLGHDEAYRGPQVGFRCCAQPHPAR